MLGELDSNNSSETDMKSRKRCLTSPGTVKKPGDVCATPPAKKLKQARLPFQPISSPPVTQICSPSPKDRSSKKRKLSETDNDLSSTPQSSKLKDKANVTPSSNKKPVTKATSKTTPAKGRAVKAPDSDVVEIEVTSSSEDAVAVAKSPNKKKLKPLDRFLQPHQEPTSTSDEEVIAASAKSKDKKDTDSKDDTPEDAEPPKTDSKVVKSSSSDVQEVTVTEDSNDGCKDEDCDVSLVSNDEASAAEDSVLDSSTASEASCNTSIDEGKDKDSKPADSASEATPKAAPKPPAKKPLSAKAKAKLKKREEEREKKLKEKERLKEEKKQKMEKEKEDKRKQKEAAKAEKDAQQAELKRLKEVEKEKKAEAKRLREMEKERKQKQKEQEEKEKMEKQKLKIQELEAKNEEKRLKMLEKEKLEEEKKQKLEEKEKVEEEKRQKKEKEEEKKRKQQTFFKSFFKKVEAPPAPPEPKKEDLCGGFEPFHIQKGMVLAPVCGFEKLQDEDVKKNFDDLMKSQDTTCLYVDQLKTKEINPGKRTKTVFEKDTPIENTDDEDSVQMVEDIKEPEKKDTKKKVPKAKLLQFHENYRPAYYGSWQKFSKNISPRNPLKKDEDFLDYDIDSDEEWEEPGESLSDSEGENDDNESDGGDSDEDGFFVEHGYLSESEDPIDEDETPEQWRQRRKAKALAWDVEKKRQAQELAPIIIGCVWIHGEAKKQSRIDRNKLQAYQAVSLVTLPIETALSSRKSPVTVEKKEGRSPTPDATSKVQKKMPVPEEAMSDLVRLVHGNPVGIKSLVREFREYWRLQELKRSGTPQPSDSTSTKSAESSPAVRSESPKPAPTDGSSTSSTPGTVSSTQPPSSSPSPAAAEASSTNSTPEETEKVYTISKRQLEKKIPSIAVREKREKFYARPCWYVHEEVLKKYNLTDLPVPTKWEHMTGPLAKNRTQEARVPYSLLPPQNVTSTPSSSAKRIVPTKVSSPSSSVLTMLQKQPEKSARRIVPTKVGNGALVKPIANVSIPTTGPIVVDSSSAAGMLATVAVACSADQQKAAILAQAASTNVPSPHVVSVLPPSQQVATASQNTSVLIAAQPQAPVKPSKKVRTLDSFFGGKPKKPSTQKDSNAKDNDKTVDMEVTEVPSTTVSDDSSVNQSKTSETKMEVDAPENNAVVKKTPEKEKLNVIKDLLSQAKQNRLKSSPERQTKKSGPAGKVSQSSKPDTSSSSETKDDPEIIMLD